MSGIVSTRLYYPGDLIYTEAPFACVLRRTFRHTLCETCHKRAFSLKTCTNCKEVKYCGKACQKLDWPDHKLECKYMKNLTEGVDVDLTRLLGRVILKIKGKEWDSIEKRVFKTVATFEDIDSHIKEFKEDTRVILFCEEIKGLVKKFIKEENMPSDDQLIEIIGKVIYNMFVMRKSEPGMYFFIGLPAFDHECIPNSNAEIRNNELKIWANKKIKRTTDKITVDYKKIHFRRFVALDSTIPDKCKCTDCSLPYGESILSRIIDRSRAYSVITETERFFHAASVLAAIDASPSFETVEGLLNKQKGVLGSTHVLHVKLLGFLCFETQNHPFRTRIYLKQLEDTLRTVFGEYCLELIPVYKALIALSVPFGNLEDTIHYIEKMRKFERYAYDSD